METFGNPSGNVSSHLMQTSLDVPISFELHGRSGINFTVALATVNVFLEVRPSSPMKGI